jgi:ubiquinone/menaquinone biosynthesis C-methylase UbiE
MNVTDKLHLPGKRQGVVFDAFGCPRGIWGAIGGWLMARMSVKLNAWAVSKLDVQPDDHVLEIGFGPGVAVQEIAEQASGGLVAGIDPSDVMVRQASKRNASAIKAGRVELHQGSVASLPYGDSRFDKALSVNNIMLWPGPGESMEEVRRVLKPGACLVITLNPRWANTPQDVEDIGREITMHASEAGFVPTNTEFRKLKPAGAVAVTAIAPGS